MSAWAVPLRQGALKEMPKAERVIGGGAGGRGARAGERELQAGGQRGVEVDGRVWPRVPRSGRSGSNGARGSARGMVVAATMMPAVCSGASRTTRLAKCA